MHATPVKLLVRAVFWFTWRVGVRVLFLSLPPPLVYKLKSLIVAHNLNRLCCASVAPFCGCVSAPWLNGKEELDVKQSAVT